MTGRPDPEEIRSRRFETVRRGYDRGEVDRFREEAADAVESLTSRIGDLESQFRQVGLSEPRDVKDELDAISEEVGRILDAARAAAEQMRSRASVDAARWRAEADGESRRMREEAQTQSEALRGAAWETGTEMLGQALTEENSILERAKQDALFIRAQAEREALRLTGDARRDAEEEIRSSRTEADRQLMEARLESETILEAARQSAEAAQERARALEQRRGELMEELEAARLSIGQLEAEIDVRREALYTAGAAEPSAMRVITGEDEAWYDNDSSVRILPPARRVEPGPVDADALAAEVEEMRRRSERMIPPPIREETLAEENVAAEPPAGEPPAAAPVVEHVEPTAPAAAAPEVVALAAEPVPPIVPPPAPAPAPAPVPEPAEPEMRAEPEPPAGPAAQPEPEAGGVDDLSGLFDSLRHPEESAPTDNAASARGSEGSDAPASAAAGSVATATKPAVSGPTPSVQGNEPFDIRDRMLLPIENRALRAVKRQIVDLQNRALEELRVSGEEWQPDAAMFTAGLGDDIKRLGQESLVAGYAGAAELAGSAETPQPSGPPLADATGGFASELTSAVVGALDATKAAGGGPRQMSSSASKVFRAWRTDEAERRLRRVAYETYHEGLLRAFPLMGVDRVAAVAAGTPCGECPAGTGATWQPGSSMPDGTRLPPAGEGCTATLVPAS